MWLKTFCAAMAVISCLLLPAPASASTQEPVYTMTEAEMQALDSRLTQLSSQIKASNKALSESQAALTQSQAELSRLKAESLALQQQMQEQSSLLESVNRYLQESAQEEKRTRQRLKLQRTLAYMLAVAALCYAVK